MQDQSRAVLLVPHQMNASLTHEVHNADWVAKVKYRRAGGELAFMALQPLKQRIQFS